MPVTRLCALLNNQHIPVSYSIYQYFSHSSANCLPRGAGLVTSERSVRRRKVIVNDEDSTNESSDIRSSLIELEGANKYKSRKPMVSQQSNFKDTRSIDSIDPVILKYTQLLEELDSKTALPNEKVYFTNFGNVRFDNDNVPKIHGHFDKIEGPDKEAVVDENIMNSFKDGDKQVSGASQESRQTGHGRNGLTERDERVFEELFGDADDMSDDWQKFASESNSSSITVRTDATDKDQVKKRQSSLAVQGAGFIDEQFFSDKVLQGNLVHNNVKANSNGRFSSLQQSNSMQYGEGYQETLANTGTPIQDLDSTKDLNFIDETYFKPSLDAIRENQQPTVEFSKIKGDLDKAFADMAKPSLEMNTPKMYKEEFLKEELDIGLDQTTSSIARSYLGLDNEMKSTVTLYHQQNKEKKKTPPKEDSSPKNAYDYVLKKRRDIHEGNFGLGKEEAGELQTSERYKKILSLVNERTVYSCTKSEMFTLLKNSIIYDRNDIVGLYKPYGLTMHEGTSNPFHILEEFLPEIASHLNAEKLHVIHRLDAKTTGVLLLARTSSMASTLRGLLKEQKIKKTYWTITKGIPAPLHGTIDIPIAEGSIDGKYRMVLRPDVAGFRGATDKCQQAVTDYRVLSRNVNSAWVELNPRTGVKHQIRVHLGLGLACPVLGDHKYSLLKKLVPQKLPGDMLQRLKLKQSEVRKLPIYLHSRRVLIPEIIGGRDIVIEAKVPAFFNKTLSALKLNTYNNRVRYRGSRCIEE